jgi:hypothetical protein
MIHYLGQLRTFANDQERLKTMKLLQFIEILAQIARFIPTGSYLTSNAL